MIPVNMCGSKRACLIQLNDLKEFNYFNSIRTGLENVFFAAKENF